jgi:hypothetical protein
MCLTSRTVSAPFSAAALFVFALVPAVALAQADASQSVAAAKELCQALDAAKLDSIAAHDPADPASFVAALYFPGSQLLVVSAKYSAPSLLETKIGAKEYRDVYIDLQSASISGSKVFVQDQLANGLLFRPVDDGAADVWESAAKTVSFDGEWKKAKLSEEEYTKAFTEADAKYAEMLTLLLKRAKGTGSE